MADQKLSLFKDFEKCKNWTEIARAFAEFPNRIDRRDGEGNLSRDGWIFRGHKSHEYRLQPTIERQYPYPDWADTEPKALREFQSKAQLHLNPNQLPPLEHKLAWLELMQHYGAPTRLLDFTYSPYVALYFALRFREEKSEFVEVWAIDPGLLLAEADKIFLAAKCRFPNNEWGRSRSLRKMPCHPCRRV